MKRKLLLLIVTVASILAMLITSGAIGVLAENDADAQQPIDTGAIGDGNTVGETDNDAQLLYTGLDGFKKIASSSSKELYMLELKKQAIVFGVKDLKTNTVLYSSPANTTMIKDQLLKQEMYSAAVLSYQDKKTVVQKCYTGAAVVEGDYKIENLKDGNGVRITFSFPDVEKGQGFTVPMTFALKDDHFDVSVELNSIKIDKKCTSELLSIAMMPYFGCASYGQEGYMLLPDGSGALMDNSFMALDGSVKYYSSFIYGRDAALKTDYKLGATEPTVLPVFGTKLGGQAWLGVVETGDAVSIVKAVSARENFPYTTSYNEVIFNKTDSFASKTNYNIVDYQQVTYEPTDLEAATVRYYGLTGDDADYVGMANAYRDYLSEQGVGSELSEDLPFYLETIGAYKKTESVLGFVTDVTKVATSVEQAEAMVKALGDKGIDNISLRYQGWMKGGIYGSVVTNSKHESKLGSVDDFVALNKLLNEQGGQMYLEMDMVNIYRSKGTWTPNKFAVRNLLNNHAMQNRFFRSTGDDWPAYQHYLCIPQLYSDQVEGFFKDFDKYEGITGISAGSMGKVVYSNLNDTASKFTDAQQTADFMEDALAAIDKNLGDKGSVMVEIGNSFTLKTADVVIGLPMYSNGYEFTFTDVPFAQLALHGLVNYTESAHNLTFDTTIQLLRQLETGSAPYYLLTNCESSDFLNTRLSDIYSSQYKTWLDAAAKDYEVLSKALNGYHDKQITDHDIITDDVRATTYGEDRTILVNYSDEDYVLGGTTVPSRGYAVVTRSEYESLTATQTIPEGGEEQ